MINTVQSCSGFGKHKLGVGNARRIFDSIYHLNRKYGWPESKRKIASSKWKTTEREFNLLSPIVLYLSVAKEEIAAYLILLLTRQRFRWWRWLIFLWSVPVLLSSSRTPRRLHAIHRERNAKRFHADTAAFIREWHARRSPPILTSL